MKNLYWRSQRISRTALILIAIGSCLSLLAVERFKERVKKPDYTAKIQAARLAKTAFQTILEARNKRRLPVQLYNDPAGSGLIGDLMSEATTNYGSLGSKRTSVNPNFAAVMVHYLRQAGLSEGDVVAVGYSGSFPAINITTLAAIQTLKLIPIVIASASASQWGANLLGFLWADMEKELYDQGVFEFRSVAVSVGGVGDRGKGLPKKGLKDLHRSIESNDYTLLESENFSDAVEQRMQIYYTMASGRPIKAYINVGGGTISVGKKIGKQMFSSGLNRKAPPGASAVDGIMSRFAETGVPVIHMYGIKKIAETFGLPIEPSAMPVVGQGDIYAEEAYNRWVIAAALFLILLSLYLITRSDVVVRLARSGKTEVANKNPEPMV